MLGSELISFRYSKTCHKRPLTIRQGKVLKTKANSSLMKVESITECSPLENSAILLTHIKR